MKQLDLFKPVYQPRFQAYLDYSGKTSHKEVGYIEYTSWVRKHLEDYKNERGIRDLQPLTPEQDEEFNEILFSLSGKG